VIFYDPTESTDNRLDRAVRYVRGALLGEPVVTRRGVWVARAHALEYDARYRLFRTLVCLALMLPLWFEPISWRPESQRSCDAACRRPAAVCELVLALLCLGFTGVRVVLFGARGVRKRPIMLVAATIAALIALDALYAVIVATEWPWRPTRVLRPLMILVYNSNMLHLSGAAARTLPYVFDLLLLGLLVLLVYATLGTQLFRDAYIDARAALRANTTTIDDLLPVTGGDFGALGSAIVSMFVLMLTENYPSTMYPALDLSQWALLFFASYIVLMIRAAAEHVCRRQLQRVRGDVLARRARAARQRALRPDGGV
jgi:hypothetical protein